MLLSHRFHQLYPEEEKYVNEIEKSIYNVIMANQSGSKGIRYHAKLLGEKSDPTAKNTCCEGQGTRQYGKLPEYIYSVADDGLYVNLFAGSKIMWKHNNQDIHLHMKTNFPFDPNVTIHVSVQKPTNFNLRIRSPLWAKTVMPVKLNGKRVIDGEPGSYVSLDQKWSDGDTLSFELPIGFRVIRYEGMDPINRYHQPHDHYALLYGPILMALVGKRVDKSGNATIKQSPVDLVEHLKPKNENQPLHFIAERDNSCEFIPYYQVEKESFTCFPRISKKS
jgi:DUF1680 family protein